MANLTSHVKSLALSMTPLLMSLDDLAEIDYSAELGTKLLSCLKTTNAILAKIGLPNGANREATESMRRVAVAATALVQIRSGCAEGDALGLVSEIRTTIRSLLTDVKTALTGSRRRIGADLLGDLMGDNGAEDEMERHLQAMRLKASSALKAASPKKGRTSARAAPSSSPVTSPLQTAASPPGMVSHSESTKRAPELVTINVGGQLFTTAIDTLTQNGRTENYFTALLQGFTTRDSNGNVFVDRSGSLFEPILHFLRSGCWVCPSHLPELVYRQEAARYGIVPTTYASITDVLLNSSIERFEDSQYLLRGQEYVAQFQRVKKLLVDEWVPLAEKGGADMAISFVPYLSTLLIREKKEFVSVQELAASFRDHTEPPHRLIIDDALYETLDDAGDVLVWDLKEHHALSVTLETHFVKAVLRKVPFLTIRWEGRRGVRR